MAHSPRLEWWTGADPAFVRPIADGWDLRVGGSGDPDVFRVHAASGGADRLPEWTPGRSPVGDLDGLWRRVTGPARVETLRVDQVVAVTEITATGDLTTHVHQLHGPSGLIGDAADLLALHHDVVAAALSTRATGVELVLVGHIDDAALASAVHAWFTARISEKA